MPPRPAGCHRPRRAAEVVGPWISYSASTYAELLKTEIDLMNGLARSLTQLKVETSRDLIDHYAVEEKTGLARQEGASLRGLRRLLDELDPSQHWGALKKVLTPEGHYLWLCAEHAKAYR